ncbi:hypothetical protein Y71_16470 [Kosakonia radicincitans DSM 16656]|uniref:Uncharacterized protein n=1 Tax=Citrobacter bitternis TaxID=1585982 RepID=A0ABW1Q0P8_9ENTR|nr:hypothetical protein [Kosakonia radicincitans]ARD61441.1 hypothetical protein Y71_16470 [Kosakonia radicincitans DSM 16656]EGT0021641.1 hypothetical protein [Citrobacter freundii]EGT0458944.1 hypothetical protein [Citrobacter freundii]
MPINITTRTEFERMAKAKDPVLEPPRQAARNPATGRFVSNERLPDALPPYLISQQMNITFYNDIDVETFKQEVRLQITRILDDLRGERFNAAGIKYQQFIDQYDACFRKPSPQRWEAVEVRGIDLYAILENLGAILTDELHLQEKPGVESLRRFSGITDAHINLFFYMLELNLAINNQIDSAEGQLLTKLAQLENRLTALLEMYIHGDRLGRLWSGEMPASQLLYGWVLLEQNNLPDAMEIYDSDPRLKDQDNFAALHAEVFKIYKDHPYEKVDSIRNNEFRWRGLSDFRTQIALKLCYYLRQIKKIRQYIDELTQNSDITDPHEATVDIRQLLVP